MAHSAAVPAVVGTLEASQEADQYLTFIVAHETFAFGIHNIKEIIEYGHVTQVPMMPRYVRGVINLRGNVVPVIDLAARFQRELSTINKRSCIVIVELEGEDGLQVIGVVVDSVCEVLDIEASEIEPPPAFGTRLRTEFIQGMGKMDDKFVIILNMNKVLALDELTALNGLAQTVTDESAS